MKTPTPNVRFVTEQFVASHGKAPRGHGTWAFAPRSPRPGTEEPVFFNGSFTEAKKQAARHFKLLGHTVIVVCP